MLKKLKNNNKGSFTQWQRGWYWIIAFCVFLFALDILFYCLQVIVTNHQLNYVADKLAYQGGFLAGSSSTYYWSNTDIYSYLQNGLIRYGIDGKKYHWKLTVQENGGGDTIIVDTNGYGINTGYRSRTIGVVPGGQIASNYGSKAKLTLTCDNVFWFSRKLFNYASQGKRKLKFTAYYQSQYINGGR